MAVEARPTDLTRNEIAKFIGFPRGQIAFESLLANGATIFDTVAQIQGSQLILTAPSDVFDDASVLADSDNIVVSTVLGETSFDLTDTGASAGDYGDASHVIQIEVDAKGRIVSISEFALDSDNVAEGSTNLYFTDDRARSTISGSGRITYNPATGVIGSNIVNGFTGTVSPVNSITVNNGIVAAVS